MTAAAVAFLMALSPAPPRDSPETAALVPAIVDLFARLRRPTTLPANPGAVAAVSQAVADGMGMAVAPLLVSSALPSGAQGRPHSPDAHVEASLVFGPCVLFFSLDIMILTGWFFVSVTSVTCVCSAVCAPCSVPHLVITQPRRLGGVDATRQLGLAFHPGTGALHRHVVRWA